MAGDLTMTAPEDDWWTAPEVGGVSTQPPHPPFVQDGAQGVSHAHGGQAQGQASMGRCSQWPTGAGDGQHRNAVLQPLHWPCPAPLSLSPNTAPDTQANRGRLEGGHHFDMGHVTKGGKAVSREHEVLSHGDPPRVAITGPPAVDHARPIRRPPAGRSRD